MASTASPRWRAASASRSARSIISFAIDSIRGGESTIRDVQPRKSFPRLAKRISPRYLLPQRMSSRCRSSIPHPLARSALIASRPYWPPRKRPGRVSALTGLITISCARWLTVPTARLASIFLRTAGAPLRADITFVAKIITEKVNPVRVVCLTRARPAWTRPHWGLSPSICDPRRPSGPPCFTLKPRQKPTGPSRSCRPPTRPPLMSAVRGSRTALKQA
jgi:hypothetical protein